MTPDPATAPVEAIALARTRGKWTPKRLIRSLVLRAAAYFEITESRTDPRYQSSQIFARVTLGQAALEGNNLICEDTVLLGNVSIGYASTLGQRCVVHGTVSIGRFCQIGTSVAMYAVDHPTDHLTTYVSNALFGGELRRFSTERRIVIGSDVWIGHGSVIVKGVTVGHGAVIGAGSIVTRDVPPYAIVAGNPARIVRKRFDDEVIERLEQLAWWNLPSAQLAEIRDVFQLDLRTDKPRALALVEDAIARVGAAHRSGTAAGRPIIASPAPERRERRA